MLVGDLPVTSLILLSMTRSETQTGLSAIDVIVFLKMGGFVNKLRTIYLAMLKEGDLG